VDRYVHGLLALRDQPLDATFAADNSIVSLSRTTRSPVPEDENLDG
jgi:hypothetical protein